MPKKGASMKFLILVALVLVSLSGYTAIYEQQSNNGTIYSDTPTNNAQAVSLPSNNSSISLPHSNPAPANTPPSASSLPSLPDAAPVPAEAEATKPRTPYTTFTMTDPTDQKTFQNQQDIPVTFKIAPDLQQGDMIQLFLDGKPEGGPSNNLSDLAIHNVDRGEHQLSAALSDASGHTLMKTTPITIFIHYSAIPTGSGAVPGSGAGNRSAPGLPAAPNSAVSPNLPAAPNNPAAPFNPAAPSLPASPLAPAAP